MTNKDLRPAARMLDVTLDSGWKVVRIITPEISSKSGAICYEVHLGSKKGFMKAFDLSDLHKPGGRKGFKELQFKIDREENILKRCKDLNLSTVIDYYEGGEYYHNKGDLNTVVYYFILEYCENGSVLSCLEGGGLKEFASKLQAIECLLDGLDSLHADGITHLDIKPENMVYFIEKRIGKLVDFGSARKLIPDIDKDLEGAMNNIEITYHYAPPEYLYGGDEWTDWFEYRRKMDLFLAGNVIVRILTQFTFTALLRNAIPQSLSWKDKRNYGKHFEFLPDLTAAASEVYLMIEKHILTLNFDNKNPLTKEQVRRIVEIIRGLCNPDPRLRGHIREVKSYSKSDGLYRFRDRVKGLKEECLLKIR